MTAAFQPAALVATLGSEPQVVTAALDLLLTQGERISRVNVVHTVKPGSTIASAVETLSAEFSRHQPYKPYQFELIPVIVNGCPVTDVDSPAESQAAFREIYACLRRAKRRGERVHLCIAGGRKTLSIFGMVSAQLLFDDDDHLWHLFSGGDFLISRRLHPTTSDDVHLAEVPVLLWHKVSPIFSNLRDVDDPAEALKRYQSLRLNEKLEDARAFVHGSLSPAEERVVSLLVRRGMPDYELAEQLNLSSRTVERHLGSAYLKAAEHWDLEEVNRGQLIALLNLFYSFQPGGNEGKPARHSC